MRSKSGMRNTIYRMLEVLYSLELIDLIDWDVACNAAWAAQVAYDAYFKKLNEVRNEKCGI